MKKKGPLRSQFGIVAQPRYRLLRSVPHWACIRLHPPQAAANYGPRALEEDLCGRNVLFEKRTPLPHPPQEKLLLDFS
ncbi:MAG: hypothetical protein IJD39_06565 [Clostridia bacterium]|nr:hypothetical protein [Clostridia bacterium]